MISKVSCKDLNRSLVDKLIPNREVRIQPILLEIQSSLCPKLCVNFTEFLLPQIMCKFHRIPFSPNYV